MAGGVAQNGSSTGAATVVFGTDYVTATETTLLIKDKAFSWSNDSFDVKDSSGKDLFTIGGHASSLRGSKTLKDARGEKLAHINNKIPSLHKTQIVEKVHGGTVATVWRKKAMGMECDAGVTVGSDEHEEWEVRGSVARRSFEIVARGNVIATVRHQKHDANVLDDLKTYFLTIGAGVDSALVLSVVISLADIYHEEK